MITETHIHYQTSEVIVTRANAADLKPYFGLKRWQPWPAEGLAPRLIQGVEIRVEPLGGPYRHRCRAKCPICGKITSYGTWEQHVKFNHRNTNA